MIRSREKTHFFVFIDPNFKQAKKGKEPILGKWRYKPMYGRTKLNSYDLPTKPGVKKKRETWFDTFDVGYPASRGHTITEE